MARRTEKYQINIFAIFMMLAIVLVIAFLIASAIAFYNLTLLKIPSIGESTFLYWSSIVLAVIFLALLIYAMVEIFTHKAVFCEEEVGAVVQTQVPVNLQPSQVPVNLQPNQMFAPPMTQNQVPVNIREGVRGELILDPRYAN